MQQWLTVATICFGSEGALARQLFHLFQSIHFLAAQRAAQPKEDAMVRQLALTICGVLALAFVSAPHTCCAGPRTHICGQLPSMFCPLRSRTQLPTPWLEVVEARRKKRLLLLHPAQEDRLADIEFLITTCGSLSLLSWCLSCTWLLGPRNRSDPGQKHHEHSCSKMCLSSASVY